MMFFFTFSAPLGALLAVLQLTLVIASPLKNDVSPQSPFTVSMTRSAENAVVNIHLTNTGGRDLRVLNWGTFLSSSPNEKVDVFYKDERIDFKGLLMHYDFSRLSNSAFTLIPAGTTITTPVSLVGIYDFPVSGSYWIIAKGALSYLETGRSVVDQISAVDFSNLKATQFTSNKIDIHIDAVAASAVEPLGQALSRRGVLMGCDGERGRALRTAFENAVVIARQAAEEAAGGDPVRFEEFYKTRDPAVRREVAARFRAIMEATTRTTSGAPRYYCNDPAGECRDNIIAYTYVHSNTVANCDIFYENLPALSRRCNYQDQVGTVIHEMAHVPAVFRPYCQDYAYGYRQSVALTPEEALNNADTFALYAKAVYLQCGGTRGGWNGGQNSNPGSGGGILPIL